MANYKAVLLDWDSGKDIGPIDIADAGNDNGAKALAINRAITWLRDNGIDRVRLRIVRDGFGLGTFEVSPDADWT